MRSTHIVAFAAAAASLYVNAVLADDRLHITPPLYRELACASQQTHRAAELTTTPYPIVAAPLDVDTTKITPEVVASAR